MPRWYYWFLATAAVYLLQLFTPTGIFLMMLAAPFWSILTVNAGFATLAWEAQRGRVHRLWLIVPILWFGGYETAAIVSHYQARQLSQEIAAANGRTPVAFSPSREALVIGDGSYELTSGIGDLARHYDIPVVYNLSRDGQKLSVGAERAAGPATCERIRHDRNLASSGISEDEDFPLFGFRPTDLCGFHAPERPTLPPLIVTSKVVHEDRDKIWLPTRIERVRIQNPDGRVTVLTAGWVKPLAWLPLPVLGCYLNDAHSSWDCIHGFLHGEPVVFGGGAVNTAAIDVLAKALHLRAVPAQLRVAELGNRIDPALERAMAGEIQEALSKLDGMIADPSRPGSVPDVAILKDRPDLLAPRANGLVDAFMTAVNEGKDRQRVEMFEQLLGALDAASLARVGPRLLAGLDAHPETVGFDDNLAMRLGDLGPSALPVLDNLAIASPQPGAFLGFCRVGSAAASYAPRIAGLLRAMDSRWGSGSQFAAYLALLRLGRADLADSALQDFSHDPQYAAVRRLVTAASPPDVCAPEWQWQKRIGQRA